MGRGDRAPSLVEHTWAACRQSDAVFVSCDAITPAALASPVYISTLFHQEDIISTGAETKGETKATW